MDDPLREVGERAARARERLAAVEAAVGAVVVGQSSLIRRLVMGLVTDGHVLVEGAPGLAKTLSVQCFCECLGLDFQRIQFTPDLLPSDLLGTLVLDPREQEFRTRKGPIFANVVLADEINRAPPKVQSALLEAMQERQVSLGEETHALPRPFLVLATQNPLEQEGTYPLPEAELDRFQFKVQLGYPDRAEEIEILGRHGHTRDRTPLTPCLGAAEIEEARAVVDEVHADPAVVEYLVRLVSATRSPAEVGREDLAASLRHGASPRASRALLLAAKAAAMLDGRAFVTPYDVKQCAEDVLAHRLGMSWEAEAAGRDGRAVVRELLAAVAVP